jgi:competence protein ComEA
VNLNTADLVLLETLPQVGPAMAKRIIDWRTANGNFTSVEDLMSVTGVGDKTFAELKDLVTV